MNFNIDLNYLLVYFLGYLTTLNWIFVWQTTTLKCKFAKLWLFIRRKKSMMYTPTDFDEYAYKHWGLLGELLTCPICFTHWVGAIFTSIFVYYFQLELILIPIAFFTYPILVYSLIKKYIN